MRKKQQILETAPKDGVFKGDLRYGRCAGHTPTREDHVGLENDPVAPLVLVPKRDSFVWKKDPKVKEMVKKNLDDSQYLKNVAIGFYVQAVKQGHAHARLTVGKQRF